MFRTFPIQQVEGLAYRSIQGIKPASKFNEVGRLHLHISWPIRQPRRQPTLRDSGQNASTSPIIIIIIIISSSSSSSRCSRETTF